MVAMPATIDDLIDALPKVELHVHLEGSMLPKTLLRLATKHHLEDLLPLLEDPAEWYRFRDFAHFVEVYLQAVRVLVDEEDFAGMTYDVAADLARQNVRYAEVHVSLYNHLERGIDPRVVFAGIEHGRRRAEAEHGVVLRWIPDFAGHVGVEAGERSLAATLTHGPPSVVAFGVGGIEVDRAPFADLFARAVAAGLHSVPHAGETAGPEAVRAAVELLHAERIGHGIGAIGDRALVDELIERRIPLDVSPTSNVRTRAVASIAEHPLPAMLDAGLLVTLNSDDPPMFGTDLTGEYQRAHEMGIDAEGLAGLARNAVTAAFLDDAPRSTLYQEIDVAVESWRTASVAQGARP